MSELKRFDETGGAPDLHTTDGAEIAAAMAPIGVRFERWPLRELPADATGDDILAAYAPEVERLQAEGGYRSIDVVRMLPDHPERDAARTKFLDEHSHAEDEVRFFVAGSGQFTLHIDAKVYEVLCERGDLIGVPDGTRHWFDMSESPYFVAIRLFTSKEGWVAEFTGDTIAERFPRMAASTDAAAA